MENINYINNFLLYLQNNSINTQELLNRNIGNGCIIRDSFSF
jgi:hypothetical protein